MKETHTPGDAKGNWQGCDDDIDSAKAKDTTMATGTEYAKQFIVSDLESLESKESIPRCPPVCRPWRPSNLRFEKSERATVMPLRKPQRQKTTNINHWKRCVDDIEDPSSTQDDGSTILGKPECSPATEKEGTGDLVALPFAVAEEKERNEQGKYLRVVGAAETARQKRIAWGSIILLAAVMLLPPALLIRTLLGNEAVLGYCFGLMIAVLPLSLVAKLVASRTGSTLAFVRSSPVGLRKRTVPNNWILRCRMSGLSFPQLQATDFPSVAPPTSADDAAHPTKDKEPYNGDTGTRKETNPAPEPATSPSQEPNKPQEPPAPVPGPSKLLPPKFLCDLCGVQFKTWQERDRHVMFDTGHLGQVYAKKGLVIDDQVAEEACHQMAVTNSALEGDVDYSKVTDSARMLQSEYYDSVVEMALLNYESFHSMERGTATFALVNGTSAGIRGWAACAINDVPTQDEIRREVEAMVRRVFPEELDNVNKMMLQFKGREEELVETLRTLQERGVAQKARTATKDKRGDSQVVENEVFLSTPNKPTGVTKEDSTENKTSRRGDQEETQMLRRAMMESMLELEGVRPPCHVHEKDEESIWNSEEFECYSDVDTSCAQSNH